MRITIADVRGGNVELDFQELNDSTIRVTVGTYVQNEKTMEVEVGLESLSRALMALCTGKRREWGVGAVRNTSARQRIQAAIADPSAHNAIRDYLRWALGADPVDALNDAEHVVTLLRDWWREILADDLAQATTS